MSDQLWSPSEIGMWLVMVLAGATAVLAASIAIAGGDEVSSQITGVNLAVLGLVVAAVANGLLLGAAWNRISRAQARQQRRLTALASARE